jgi:hypothetical protein
MKFLEIKSNCPLCHSEITLRCDPCCPPEIADRLIAFTVCNRCADWRTSSRDTEERIGRLCGDLLTARRGKVTKEQEKSFLDGFTAITKSYTRAIASYFRTPTLAWHSDFPQLLMERPDRWFQILAGIRDQLRPQRQQPQPIAEQRELRATAPDP